MLLGHEKFRQGIGETSASQTGTEACAGHHDQLCLLSESVIAAHPGVGGHRGAATTEEAMKEFVY